MFSALVAEAGLVTTLLVDLVALAVVALEVHTTRMPLELAAPRTLAVVAEEYLERLEPQMVVLEL